MTAGSSFREPISVAEQIVVASNAVMARWRNSTCQLSGHDDTSRHGRRLRRGRINEKERLFAVAVAMRPQALADLAGGVSWSSRIACCGRAPEINNSRACLPSASARVPGAWLAIPLLPRHQRCCAALRAQGRRRPDTNRTWCWHQGRGLWQPNFELPDCETRKTLLVCPGRMMGPFEPSMEGQRLCKAVM